MKRVVIVGGGYAGTSLARALDAVAEVVLVEPRDRFVHNVAAIRALVEPGLLDEIVIPYDRLLKRGQVVHDRAVAIEGGSVTLAGGGSIEGNIIVIATGSRYARPFKPEAESVPSFVAASRANHQALVAAKTVAIIGAGAVGTELAGEIATAFPAKKVTLISGLATLFPAYPPRLGRKLEAQLRAMRVTLRMGAPARAPKSIDTPFTGRVEMSAGDPVKADLVFPVIGAKPVNDVLRASWRHAGFTGLSSSMASADWRAASACLAAAGDLMTIVGISRQQPPHQDDQALFDGKALELCRPTSPGPRRSSFRWARRRVQASCRSRKGASSWAAS
jgi:pyruvate/2-oxoglutarate dehydrogenase complex dihydrolipoamide dehydrogenase (E3) component